MIVSSNCKGGCDVKCENESWEYEYNLKAHDMILLSGSEEEEVVTEWNTSSQFWCADRAVHLQVTLESLDDAAKQKPLFDMDIVSRQILWLSSMRMGSYHNLSTAVVSVDAGKLGQIEMQWY